MTRAALLEGAGQVFAKMSYATARLQDIADASGTSQGSLYFHLGNKADIAALVLALQQERMTETLTRLTPAASGLEKLLSASESLAKLISSDVVVQAGIKLSQQPGTGLEDSARAPYFEWIEISATLIRQGIEDGSIDPNVNAETAAEFVNNLFVGAQVLAELRDSWQSLPEQIQRMRPHIVGALASVLAK